MASLPGSELLSEFRLATRSLARQPGFLVVAILTLALGVGSVSAIFSVVNGVLLSPLPYPDAERIIRINKEQPPFTGPVSRFVVEDWRKGTAQVFSALGAFTASAVTLTGNGDADRLAGYQVTPDFWEVMALPPLHGRWFGEAEERGDERVVVLSHALWQGRFGGDPGVVGRDIVLDGIAHRVVAVTPPAFRYPGNSAYYLPTWLPSSTAGRGRSYLSVLARLAPGASLEQADAVLRQINAGLAEQYPDNHVNFNATLVQLPELLNSGVREPLLILLAASGLVLLIACANLANLLLARGSQRQRELAVRAALGAGRRTLVRAMLVEALVIAVAGAVLGVALAAVAVPLLLAGGPQILPSHASPGIDLFVVAASVAMATLTVLVFALWPAWRASRVSPSGALQEESRGSTVGKTRANARNLLVAFEVAVSLTLLVGAGLLIESLRRVGQVDVGVDPSRVLTASIVLQPPPQVAGEDPDAYWPRAANWFSARLAPIEQRLRGIPGVERVAVTDSVPMGGGSTTNSSVNLVGLDVPAQGNETPWAMWRFASSEYFQALGIPLKRGRLLDPRDEGTIGAPTGLVVNQAFVDRYLGGTDPIGQQVGNLLGEQPQTIVGVVGDTRLFGREDEIPPEAYMPVSSMPFNEFQLVLQVQGDPAAFIEPLRRVLRELDANMPVPQVRTLEEVISGGSELRTFNLQLMLLFSGVALLLAAIGIYAVITYAVAQRRQEFGIRMSLGADRWKVVSLVLGQGMRLVLLGVVAGLAGSFALGRVLASQLFGVGGGDLLVIGAVTLVLGAVALAACAVPALRAARTAPAVALR